MRDPFGLGIGWAAGVGAGSTLALFVDSVGGDDGNEGTSEAQAFQTLGALTPLLDNGARINLKRGSFWGEQLDLSSFASIVVDDYGSAEDPMPTIDTTNVAVNANFSATGGTTNVFEIAWAHDIADAISFLRVWEDGDALVFATSVANCDATPGSCWYDGLANANNPLTVYVHPKGSTDPTSDGKEYRLSARDNCILMGAHNTVRDVFADKCCGSDGPIATAALGCRIERCLIRWGGKHHAVLHPDAGADVAFVGVIAYMQIPTDAQWGGGAIALTAFEAEPAGGNILYDGCVICDPDIVGIAAFFSHVDSGGAFDSETYKDCYTFGVSFFFSGSAAPDPLIQDCYCEQFFDIIGTFAPVTVDGFTAIDGQTNCGLFRAQDDIASSASLSDVAFQADDITAGLIFGTSGRAWEVAVDHCTFVLHADTFESAIFSDNAGTTASITNSIIRANNFVDLEAEDAVTAADLNVYDGQAGSWWTTGGVLKTGLAAWQAASSLDANSVDQDPLFAGDPSTGDFSLQGGSPAFTGGRNAGARKWRTQPNWAALRAEWDAGFYAHPTDATGGSQLVVR